VELFRFQSSYNPAARHRQAGNDEVSANGEENSFSRGSVATKFDSEPEDPALGQGFGHGRNNRKSRPRKRNIYRSVTSNPLIQADPRPLYRVRKKFVKEADSA
jgi:hypothetical protein